MVDPNTGQKMGESDDIINYLYNEYGDGNIPLLLKLGPLTAISNTLALLPRFTSRLHCSLDAEILPGYKTFCDVLLLLLLTSTASYAKVCPALVSREGHTTHHRPMA